jgi:AcrR family transcriptional regulator
MSTTGAPEVRTRTRAAAMPPEERRAAIVAATIPLLVEHGAGVTTRQIAEAAGIAEGTIFRVFDDKEALLDACVEEVLDPAPILTELSSIDLALPLEVRLEAGVTAIARRITDIWRVLTAIGFTKPPARRPGPVPEQSSLTALIEPDAARLRVEPSVAADLIRGLTLASVHPMMMTSAEPLSPAEIVSLALDGIRRHDVDRSS